MADHDYLQRFQNLVDVATSYNGQLYDQAIVDIVTERFRPGVPYDALVNAQKLVVQTASSDLYLATMFIHQSDRHQYGKLSEEFETSFTKGNDDYPDNLVSDYHLINEYKYWRPKSAAPDSSGVAFAQKGKGKVDQSNNDNSWQKKATRLHCCGEIGHIRPNCPTLKDDENKETDNNKSNTTPKSSKDTNNVEKKKEKNLFCSANCRVRKRKASPRTDFSILDSAQLLSLLL
jgi:hypothetical protein